MQHHRFLSLLCAAVALGLAFVLYLQHVQMTRQAQALQDIGGRLDAMERAQQLFFEEMAERQSDWQAEQDASLRRALEALREELAAPAWDIPLASELQQYTLARCRSAGIDPRLFLSIMWRESRFQPDAVHVNHNGTVDVGLMQINSANWQWLAERGIDVHTPQGNIDAAALMLAQYWAKGYSDEQVVAAYAAGEAGMRRGGGDWYAALILGDLDGAA